MKMSEPVQHKSELKSQRNDFMFLFDEKTMFMPCVHCTLKPFPLPGNPIRSGTPLSLAHSHHQILLACVFE